MKKYLAPLLAVLMASTLRASPLEEAEKLFDAGKTDAAVEIVRQKVSQDEKNPYLLYNYGLILYRTEHYDEAIHVFQGIDLADDKDLQSKAALQLGNIQYRLAQRLLKAKNSPGAILSMERALGYYQTANETKPGPESAANQKTATSGLETTLLNLADYHDQHAQGYSRAGNLHFEEVALRETIQARQRAAELDPANQQIPALITDATQRLIANLTRQGAEFGTQADNAKEDPTIKGRRKQSIAKYDDALHLDPQNVPLAAAREDQIKKLSNLLTDEAEALATPILQKPTPELDEKDQATLGAARAKLNDALSLDSTNTRAATLLQQIVKKLIDSSIYQGDQALDALKTTPAAKDKLALVKTAIDQYQKALDLDPQNQPAQDGLAKAQAMLTDLYAAAGREDLAAAKAMLPKGAASIKSLSNPDLQTVTTTLQSSVLNLATAVAMKPKESSYQQSLDEAQKLLDAASAETDKRNLAANAAALAAAAAAGATGTAAGSAGDGSAGSASAGGGGMLPLALDNFNAQKPVTESKFWENKTRDW